jgi:arsenite methyltransferase
VNGKPTISLAMDSRELASLYDEVGVHQFEHGKQLLAALDIRPGEQVLDIGTGTGRLAIYAVGLVGPSGRVVGIDPLPTRIEIARSKARRNFEVRLGRAEDLSEFRDASFDIVYLNSVFHWVDDKIRALREINRVLKPAGRLGISCHDPSRPLEAFHFISQAMSALGIEPDHHLACPCHGISAKKLQEQLGAAGFVQCTCESRTFVDVFPNSETLIVWASSSAFGNILVNLSEADHVRVRETVDHLLKPKLTSEGICLKRHLTFSTARKP